MSAQIPEPAASMSSPLKKKPDAVTDAVLERARLNQIVRKLKGRLAAAQYKTKNGLTDVSFHELAPQFEEMHRKRLLEGAGDGLSDDSSSSASDPYPYPSSAPTRTLMNSPLQAPLFSDAVGSSNGSSGHRKRTYRDSFDELGSSPSKYYRSSPVPQKPPAGKSAWRGAALHQLTQSSPVKQRRHPFSAAGGRNAASLYAASLAVSAADKPPSSTLAGTDSDSDDPLPLHSFNVNTALSSSPPRTPPPRTRTRASGSRYAKGAVPGAAGKSGEEGADLLLYLAHSPSPAVPASNNNSSNGLDHGHARSNVAKKKSTAMEPPSTPPTRSLALPSSMMTTPGGGNFFPNTPGQPFDFSDFIKFTPSPAQRAFKTPGGGMPSHRTPLSVARRRLTFD